MLPFLPRVRPAKIFEQDVLYKSHCSMEHAQRCSGQTSMVVVCDLQSLLIHVQLLHQFRIPQFIDRCGGSLGSNGRLNKRHVFTIIPCRLCHILPHLVLEFLTSKVCAFRTTCRNCNVPFSPQSWAWEHPAPWSSGVCFGSWRSSFQRIKKIVFKLKPQ